MKAFYWKFFNPIIRQNQKKLTTSSMKFASFNIEINSGVITTESYANSSLNWQLAKTWINPSGQVHLNSIIGGKGSTDSTEECQVSADVKSLEYDRFVRKFGLVISRQENVYVQDGIYNSKKVRMVTSDKNDAEFFSQVFHEKLNSNDSPDVHVLFLSNNSQIDNKRRFVYSSKTRRTVLTNSRNLDNIKKGLDLI
jgi:hypothetical protein